MDTIQIYEDERKRISEAAIATSLKLTDVSVARDYIETVAKFGGMIKENRTDKEEYHSMSFRTYEHSGEGQV